MDVWLVAEARGGHAVDVAGGDVAKEEGETQKGSLLGGGSGHGGYGG